MTVSISEEARLVTAGGETTAGTVGADVGGATVVGCSVAVCFSGGGGEGANFLSSG